MKAKKIPIKIAKSIAEQFNYDEVIVVAANYNQPLQHVTTYGKTKQACENAGLGGDFIKSHLKWDENNRSKYTKAYLDKIDKLEGELARIKRHFSILDNEEPIK